MTAAGRLQVRQIATDSPASMAPGHVGVQTTATPAHEALHTVGPLRLQLLYPVSMKRRGPRASRRLLRRPGRLR